MPPESRFTAFVTPIRFLSAQIQVAALSDIGARFQLWIAKPAVKRGAIVVMVFLLFLIFLGIKTLMARKRRF
ncbi:MAG TPA: hypothetical protein VMF06_01870 [Candidatus Limnocylindria bacterium]|jgi:hypothetical protein|nr:hypothetical protein [Candidatus Limnocylindria bacterium]